MINLILILIVGGLIGWIASIVMRTNAQQGIFLNVIVGIIGAVVAGFLLSPLFGTGTITQGNFSLPALLVSLLGAVILLAIVSWSSAAKSSILTACLVGGAALSIVGMFCRWLTYEIENRRNDKEE